MENTVQIAEMVAKWQARAEGFAALPPDERKRINDEAVAAHERRIAHQRAVEVENLLASIPTRYRSATVTEQRILEWCERITAHATDRGLLVMGPTGVGKTHNAWGIYRNLIEAGFRGVKCHSVPQLLAGLRPGGNEQVAELQSCSVLILDDLGAEKSSEWVKETLYSVIDSRYEWQRPTVITTNLNTRQIPEVTGERVASRLLEMVDVVAMTGADRRRP